MENYFGHIKCELHNQEAEIKCTTCIVKHSSICLADYWRGEKRLHLAETTEGIEDAKLNYSR